MIVSRRNATPYCNDSIHSTSQIDKAYALCENKRGGVIKIAVDCTKKYLNG